MRTEKPDPRARTDAERPEGERQSRQDERVRKQREKGDDGRYIIFYDFEDGDA